MMGYIMQPTVERFKEESWDEYVDLLVTVGCRAGYMSAAGIIKLPSGLDGERKVALFCADLVKDWVENDHDWGYDMFIEEKLMKKYGGKHD